jgi:hypothetical protein
MGRAILLNCVACSTLPGTRAVCVPWAAISEGIGPHLWNVVGTLGLVLVGFFLLFPRSQFIARSAHQVLINTYAIGGLSFGLLFGQLSTALASAAANVALWKAWLMGAGGVFLAFQALALNFSLWYLVVV